MISNKQSAQYLQQLHAKHPQAFKMNFILYGQIKTKGIMDELKEGIPWILAFMIFGSLSYVIAGFISSIMINFDAFRSFASATIAIMLFFMLVCPVILKQIKHSSTSLYTYLQHTPLKLAVLIILQALNLAFAQSWFLFGIIFFFAMSFGFVKFYKENMFRDSTTPVQYQYLQDIRRVCFWTYKQNFKINLQLMLKPKSSAEYQRLITEKNHYVDLHVELINFENKLCLTYKHTDVESYIDSMM